MLAGTVVGLAICRRVKQDGRKDTREGIDMSDHTPQRPLLIGVAGASASGKTLLVANLQNVLPSLALTVIHEDSYYHDRSHLPYEERAQLNYDHPNAFDHALMVSHLSQVVLGESIDIPMYDFQQHVRSDTTRTVAPAPVILIDGILILSVPEIRQFLDISVFIDTDLDICLIRRLKRDMAERGRSMDSILEQYQQTVRPMYWSYIAPSKQHADIVVTGGGNNWTAIDLIKSKIEKQLAPAA